MQQLIRFFIDLIRWLGCTTVADWSLTTSTPWRRRATNTTWCWPPSAGSTWATTHAWQRTRWEWLRRKSRSRVRISNLVFLFYLYIAKNYQSFTSFYDVLILYSPAGVDNSVGSLSFPCSILIITQNMEAFYWHSLFFPSSPLRSMSSPRLAPLFPIGRTLLPCNAGSVCAWVR